MHHVCYTQCCHARLALCATGEILHQTSILPAGNSVFFTVKRIEDPIGLLPAKLILGINKRGVHFFRPVPKEYLHSAELRDIMQFGSSSQAVFFKMRVAGVLHIFQFDTKQGEDICMALQTHINDIMMKRYSKVSFLSLVKLLFCDLNSLSLPAHAAMAAVVLRLACHCYTT